MSTWSAAFGNFEGSVQRSEYPNECSIRDVTNSEKHPRIGGKKEKPKKPKAFQTTSFSSGSVKISGGQVSSQSLPLPFKLRQPILRVVPIDYQERFRESRSPGIQNADDQYYSKKKKRKTEQEKLIASLMVTELPHVDGAFKRSTNIRYRNLNEDKLFDNLFDNKTGKPKRSSGKKVCCVDDLPELVGQGKRTGEEAKETFEKELAEEAQRLELKAAVEQQKRKRKSEREKLIENLSPIERVHVDGAFKRNASCDVSLKNGSDGNVFSVVKFVGVDEDIETLILGRAAGDAT